jgi:hypothetical protein
MVQPDIDPAMHPGYDESKFDFGRIGDRGMALGIAGLAMFVISCCINLGGMIIPFIGLAGCCTYTISGVCGVLGLVWGKKGLKEVEEGLQPAETRGRAQAGFITGLITTILVGLYVLFIVVVLVLALVFGFGAAILEGMG